MNNRALGIIAMIGAPFLFIDFCIHGSNGGGEQFEHTSLSGIFSIIYISAWMCSMIGLRNLNAAGETKSGKVWMLIPLVTLSLANVWNIWETIQPGANTLLYHLLDAFWPISNTFMLFFGIRVIIAKQLQGWRRYIPLTVGFWLPFCMLLKVTIGLTAVSMVVGGLYSAIAWLLLGYVVYTSHVPSKLTYQPVMVRS